MKSALVLLALAAGCASARPATRPAVAGCDPARDRAAIVAMAGDFRVRFAFDETEVLAPGYARHAPYRADAHEVVTVLEDGPRKVVLQHLLLLDGGDGSGLPLKHWRQDWTFEKRDLLEFRGQRTWAHRRLDEAEARCSWSQAVFEVDDGPRYESYGRWTHEAGGSTWASQSTWRPLPRREYTKRSDYDVLVGVNRHVVTAAGWRHEQDNVKLALAGARQLVRERGLNEYARIDGGGAAAAQKYLGATGRFWALVRQEWQALFDGHRQLLVRAIVDGEPLHERLFPLAEAAAPAGDDELRRQVHELIGRYVAPAPVARTDVPRDVSSVALAPRPSSTPR